MTIGYVCDIGGDHFLKPIVERFGMVEQAGDWTCDALFVEWAYRLAKGLLHNPPFPVIVRCHSFEAFQPELYATNWSNAAAVIFVAQHVLDYARERGFDHPNVHLIPPGIDTDYFVPEPRPLGKVVGFVGALNHKKGPMLLAQVIRAIVERDSEFEFRLCGGPGDPRFEAYFWHAVRDIRDNVTNLGRLEDMRPFYHGCDYVLSTSPWEGTAQSIGEGLASGCIPLVHAWPGADVQYPETVPFRTPEQAAKFALWWQDRGPEYLEPVRAALPTQADCLDAIGEVIEGVM